MTTAIFVGVAIYLYAFHFVDWLESDASVSALLAEKVIQARSPIVTDWYYANGDIWLLAPDLLAVVPVALLGLGVPSLLVTVVVGFVLELVVAIKLYSRLSDQTWVGALAAMMTLIAWSPSHAAFVYIQLAYGFLTVIYLVLFGSFGLLAANGTTRSRTVTAVLVILVVSVQNPTRGLVFLVAPILAGCIWPWREVGRRRRLALIFTAVAGWVIAFVVYRYLLTRIVAFSRPRGHLDFVFGDAATIGRNLRSLFHGLTTLCAGSDGLSLRALPGLVVIVGSLSFVGREILASRSVTAIRFVCLVIAAQIGCLLVPLLIGNLLDSTSAIRYVMPSLLVVFGLGAILAVRALAEEGAWRRIATMWLIVVPIAAAVAAPSNQPPAPQKGIWPNVAELEVIVDRLAERGLTHGYADVLAAGVTTVISHGEAWTCPVFISDIVVPQRWLADTACYSTSSLPDRFYVIARVGEQDEAALRATFPPPIDQFSVGVSYVVSVYRTESRSTGWLALPLPENERDSFPLHIPATHLQLKRGKVVIEGERMIATGETGTVLYGPYIKLPRGRYIVRWYGSGIPSSGEIKFFAVAGGSDKLAETSVLAMKIPTSRGQLTEFSFRLDHARDAMEFSVYSQDGGRVALDELVIERR